MQTSSSLAPTLTEAEAARYCSISKAFLQVSRLARPRTAGPPYVRIGRVIRYRLVDLDAWLESRRVVPAGPATA